MDQGQNRAVSANVRGVAAHGRARGGIRKGFIQPWMERLEINHLVERQ
jgi:hypothetical protein